jgi:hypothetical protein
MCYIISNNNISEFLNFQICRPVLDVIFLPKIEKMKNQQMCCLDMYYEDAEFHFYWIKTVEVKWKSSDFGVSQARRDVHP